MRSSDKDVVICKQLELGSKKFMTVNSALVMDSSDESKLS